MNQQPEVASIDVPPIPTPASSKLFSRIRLESPAALGAVLALWEQDCFGLLPGGLRPRGPVVLPGWPRLHSLASLRSLRLLALLSRGAVLSAPRRARLGGSQLPPLGHPFRRPDSLGELSPRKPCSPASQAAVQPHGESRDPVAHSPAPPSRPVVSTDLAVHETV